MSDWSDIIKIDFPEGELSTDSLSGLVNSNELDNLKVSVNDDLEAAGVFQHVGDGFTVGDTYFSHTANSIASGFLTPEQSPISLYDKILELQNEIKSLKAQIEQAVGELVVSIIDEEGNVTPISNNTTTKLFAGYYVNELPETNYKGHIVTKNFKIQLSNSKASNLELVSRIVGDTSQPVWVSSTDTRFGLGSGTTDSQISGNAYYTTEGKYDIVPVLYQNVNNVDLANSHFNMGPEQSTQVRGQFIYSRYQNLANDDSLYVNGVIDSPNYLDSSDPDTIGTPSGMDPFEHGLASGYNIGGITTDGDGFDFSAISTTPYSAETNVTDHFIWSGSGNSVTKIATVTNQRYDNSILLHIDHPLAGSGTADEKIGFIGIPKTASLNSFDPDGKKQTPFRLINATGLDNQGRRSIKTSFEEQDQYLLGGKSCGSFLYISPLDRTSHIVDANNKSGKVTIPGNSSNSISIDLVFQYRMTDYHGVGSTGTGKIGGIVNENIGNLTYSKKIGIDLLDSNNNEFQFDVEVYAKYKATGRNINSITSSMIDSLPDPSGNEVL